MTPVATTRPYRLLHLSDTHLGADGHDEDGVDATGSMRLMLEGVARIRDIDAVLVTGDVADDGSVEGYRRVLAELGPFGRDLGIPQVFTTGNHDARAPFTEVLGSGHLGPDGRDIAVTSIGSPERAAASVVGGLRIVTLDSLVPGRTEGRISPAQLEWLAEVLATPAPDGTVVGVHHPPIHLAGHPMERVVLQNPEDLGRVLRGSDVHAVLCGHLHNQISGLLGGIPVWTTPGVVTRIDLTSPAEHVRGVLGASATLVDVGGPSSPVCTLLHARDPRAGELVYLIDAETGEDVPPGRG